MTCGTGFASLLAEGRTIHYVAKQLGHSALMTMNTYGHVIDELEDEVRVNPEKEILAVRASSRPLTRVAVSDR
jgi:integrase